MGLFSVPVVLSHPHHPERRLTIDLMVDTGAAWTLLPQEVVEELGLEAPWPQLVRLASGDRVTYSKGSVSMQLSGQQLGTVFLAGPPGVEGLLGAVTLEEFGLAPDPVNQRLVPVVGFLLASTPE